MNVNELAYLLYCHYFGLKPNQDGQREQFFKSHAMELADFMEFRTNRLYVPPVEAFYECFRLEPKNGMPLSGGLEEYLTEWVNLKNQKTPEPINGIPLPTDEDGNYHYNQPSNVPPLIPLPEPAGQTGFFIVKSANDTIKEAAERPDPVPLYRTLWFEGEACCLYADANIGKSILAVQIATAIAQKQLVLLFDFELSDKMFQLRYTDEETKQLYNFPQKLFRPEINPENLDFNSNFEDTLIKNIEQTAISLEAKVIIVDNLTWICNESEKGDAAGQLMKALVGFTRKYGWSILVIAHTPKRSLNNPITQNDLAGSKKLMNFFDSAFAIGRSAKDENLVYIKQIKVRNDVFRYASENVIVCTIEKIGAFLHFKQIGFASESEHLKKMESKEEQELKDSVYSLAMEGKSQRAIGEELHISPSKVNRILKKMGFNN